MKIKYTNIIWGVCIASLGIVLLSNALGLLDIDIFFKGWWTLFIIVPSVFGLFNKGEVVRSLIFLFLGVGLLLVQQGYISYNVMWKSLLAIAIIIVGINTIIAGLKRRKRESASEFETTPEMGSHPGGVSQFAAFFSGNKKSYINEHFYGAKAIAVFGGIELDLRQAIIDRDVEIDATAVFGGVDIYLPNNTSCDIAGTNIFGGSDNKVPNKNPEAPTVFVNNTSIFGGVEVK